MSKKADEKRVTSKSRGRSSSKGMGSYCRESHGHESAESSKFKELERKAKLHRKMIEMCKGYDEQPFAEMTDREVTKFAILQSEGARNVIRIRDGNSPSCSRAMTREEQEQFAAAIDSSIKCFNRRSEEHNRAMYYREQCRIEAEEERRRQIEIRQQAKDLAICFM